MKIVTPSEHNPSEAAEAQIKSTVTFLDDMRFPSPSHHAQPDVSLLQSPHQLLQAHIPTLHMTA